jgi:hypothetical protein
MNRVLIDIPFVFQEFEEASNRGKIISYRLQAYISIMAQIFQKTPEHMAIYIEQVQIVLLKIAVEYFGIRDIASQRFRR